jgi:EAL domain-containing protein (putative c-di-GMP-specific phosphodiesterase class I)
LTDLAAGRADDLPTAGWEGLIAAAIDGVGVGLVFQPIVDLRRGTIAGYEALVRFSHGPVVGPDRWFAEAHRLGLAAELDAVCTRLALGYRSHLPPNCFLSINVEPPSFAEPAFDAVLTAAGDLSGVVLELTEHQRIASFSDTEHHLSRHRRNGALVAVDDAGAGHSGLQQILELRPSILKLDRSLVSGVDSDQSKASLIEYLGAFAAHIDAWVLAEGVERAAEVRRLRHMGVPLAQGFLFARPAQPWVGISGEGRAALDSATVTTDPRAVGRLVEPSPWLYDDELDMAPQLLAEVDADLLVVVDRDQRPLGLLGPSEVIDGGEIVDVVKVNVGVACTTTAQLVAARRDGRHADPVIATDDAGRYVGVLRLPALLDDLARRAEMAQPLAQY